MVIFAVVGGSIEATGERINFSEVGPFCFDVIVERLVGNRFVRSESRRFEGGRGGILRSAENGTY
jgi:hypothetical protein